MKATHVCDVPVCDRPADAHGWCHAHYRYWKRTGLTPTHRLKAYRQSDALARFMAKVVKAPSGHWIWIGSRTSGTKYGTFRHNGRCTGAHRAVWELLRGPIPDGCDIDHLCRLPICVNPLHLDSCTPQTNTLRGTSPSARNAAKDRCNNGHPFTPENTLRWGVGRRCRTCYRAWVAARRYDMARKNVAGQASHRLSSIMGNLG